MTLEDLIEPKSKSYKIVYDTEELGELYLTQLSADKVDIKFLDYDGKQLTPPMVYPATFYKFPDTVNKMSTLTARLYDIKPKDMLKIIYDICTKIDTEGLPGYKIEGKDFGKEHYDEAMEILEHGEPLKYIRNAINFYHVGDAEIIPLPYFSLMCLGLNISKKINLQTHGETGKGKSNLYMTVFKTLPGWCYEIFTNLSPRALEYVDEGIIEDKILYWDEIDAVNEDTVVTLRIVSWGGESHVNPAIAMTVKDQEALLLKFKGRNNAVWMTGTKPVEDDQLLSRFIVLGVDTSEEQDKVVYERLKRSQGGAIKSELPFEFRVIRAMINILLFNDLDEEIEKDSVLIPYRLLTDFKLWKDRRSYTLFVNLIMASAKLHSFQRPKFEYNNVNYILAYPKDFEYAKAVFNRIASTQASKLTGTDLDILKAIPDSREALGIGATYTEIAETTGLPRPTIVAAIKNRLLVRGFINGDQTTEGKRIWNFWRSEAYDEMQNTIKSSVNINWELFTFERFKEALIKDEIPLELIKPSMKDVYSEMIDLDEFLMKLYPLPEPIIEYLKFNSDKQEDMKKMWLEKIKLDRSKGLKPTFSYIYDSDKNDFINIPEMHDDSNISEEFEAIMPEPPEEDYEEVNRKLEEDSLRKEKETEDVYKKYLVDLVENIE